MKSPFSIVSVVFSFAFWENILECTVCFKRLYYILLKQVNNGKCIAAVRSSSGHIPV